MFKDGTLTVVELINRIEELDGPYSTELWRLPKVQLEKLYERLKKRNEEQKTR